MKSALQAINEAVNAGKDPRQLNRQIVSLIRDGLYIASGARTNVGRAATRSASERLGLPGWLHVATAFADTDSGIRSAVIPQLPLEMSVLTAIIGPAHDLAATSGATGISRTGSSERSSAGPSPAVATGSTPPARPEEIESRHVVEEEPIAPQSSKLKDMVRKGAGNRKSSDQAPPTEERVSAESVPAATSANAIWTLSELGIDNRNAGRDVARHSCRYQIIGPPHRGIADGD